MQNIESFAQTMTGKIPEFKISLRLNKFYKHSQRAGSNKTP